MSRDLKHQNASEQPPGPGEQGAAREARKVGHIHGIAGQAVDAPLAESIFSRGRKGRRGKGQQDRSQRIHGKTDGKASYRRILALQKHQAKHNGRVGALIKPVCRLFPSLQGREIGGPLDCIFIIYYIFIIY